MGEEGWGPVLALILPQQLTQQLPTLQAMQGSSQGQGLQGQGQRCQQVQAWRLEWGRPWAQYQLGLHAISAAWQGATRPCTLQGKRQAAS